MHSSISSTLVRSQNTHKDLTPFRVSLCWPSAKELRHLSKLAFSPRSPGLLPFQNEPRVQPTECNSQEVQSQLSINRSTVLLGKRFLALESETWIPTFKVI